MIYKKYLTTEQEIENNIIKFYILYILLITIPIIDNGLSVYFNGYTVAVLIFFLVYIFIANNILIKSDMVGLTAILLVLQFISLTFSYEFITEKNYILPLMYALNLMNFYVLVKDFYINYKSLMTYLKFNIFQGTVRPDMGVTGRDKCLSILI